MSIGNVTHEFLLSRSVWEATRRRYATLLNDCVRGDATLFGSRDSVEAAWALVDPILASGVPPRAPPLPQYPREVGAKRIPISARAVTADNGTTVVAVF